MLRTKCYLGLGSNLGDRRKNLLLGMNQLRHGGLEVFHMSHFYSTPPWGLVDQPPFLNAAVLGFWPGTPEALLQLALEIERAAGRIRGEKWGPRTLDIDILDFGQSKVELPDLRLPHPFLEKRAFVLGPLREIGPDLRPGGGEFSVEELWHLLPEAERQTIQRIDF